MCDPRGYIVNIQFENKLKGKHSAEINISTKANLCITCTLNYLEKNNLQMWVPP